MPLRVSASKDDSGFITGNRFVLRTFDPHGVVDQKKILSARDAHAAPFQATPFEPSHAHILSSDASVTAAPFARQADADRLEGPRHGSKTHRSTSAIVTHGDPCAEKLHLTEIFSSPVATNRAGGVQPDRAALDPAGVAAEASSTPKIDDAGTADFAAFGLRHGPIVERLLGRRQLFGDREVPRVRASVHYPGSVPSLAALQHAPWSISKIQCALRCPREFHFRYVDRISEPEVAPETRLGKAIHAALEQVLGRIPLADALAVARRELLSDEERQRFDALGHSVGRFVERIAAFRGRRRVRSEFIEHRLAVTFDFAPTEFLAKNAFFRGVWDVGYLFDDGVLAVVDHKTGIRRPGADFADQLGGYAALAGAHMGFLKKVWLGVHFVGDAALEWAPPTDLLGIRAEVAPRLQAYIEEAAAAARGQEPRMSTWCVRCSYRSICPAIRAAALAELPEPAPELVDDRPED